MAFWLEACKLNGQQIAYPFPRQHIILKDGRVPTKICISQQQFILNTKFDTKLFLSYLTFSWLFDMQII